jgi:hypothetical protein
MTLSDLASLGSFVSGFAVLLSLIFLALQLRQSNANQRALIQMGRSTRVIDSIHRTVEPHLRSVMLRGRSGDTSMSPEEIEAFLQATYAAFMSFEDTYLQSRAGTIDPTAWEVSTERLKTLFAMPGWRVSWRKRRVMFGSDFARAIDQIVSQARSPAWQDQTASWAADVAAENALTAA